MKLPENALIHSIKLTQYLLTPRKRNDKSRWLAEAGYTIDNWQILETDLRSQILTIDATPTEKTKFVRCLKLVENCLDQMGIVCQ